MNENEPLFTGEWNDQVSWEFHPTNKAPPSALTTAAFCVSVRGTEVLLVRNAIRGWEMPGGHVKSEEVVNIEATAKRETEEEGRLVISDPTIFGYRKVIAATPQLRRGSESTYPYPVSYVNFYLAQAQELKDFTPTEEITERRFFSLQDTKELLQRDSNIKILEYAFSIIGRLKDKIK